MKDMSLYLLQNLIVIDVLIVLVIVCEKLFKCKSGHLWRKFLWFFICVRMIFPIEISLQMVYENWKPVNIEVELEVPMDNPVKVPSHHLNESVEKIHIYDPVFIADEEKMPEEIEGQAENSEKISMAKFIHDCWEIVIVGIWMFGFCICLFYHIFQYYLIKDFYLEDAKISDNKKICSLVKSLSGKYGIRKVPIVLEKEGVMSPMTFGYLKKQIIFQENMYDVKELPMIIRHELIHIKNYDSWYKTLIWIVCDLYWFNPVFLIMKRMAFSDVEFVCDECIQKELTSEELQKYGTAIIKTGKTSLRSAVPSMIEFSVRKKDLKNRLNNLFEFRSWKKGFIPLLFCILGMMFAVGCVSLTIKKVPVVAVEQSRGENSFTIPKHETTIETFYTDNLQAIQKQKDVKSSYITERYNSINHYYIDKEGVLWGSGSNDCWQLGIAKDADLNNYDANYDTPVKIAENVVHVDANINGEFMIYLTEDGNLYGLGENTAGVLRMPLITSPEYLYPKESCTAEPKLLMSEVTFASAGQSSVSVLTKDGNVWWWGRIGATAGTADLTSIYANEPKLMIKNARYTVCGPTVAAAIDENNHLWLWGCNVFGQCGKEGADYLLEPYMASENVEMVWPEFLSTRQNVFDTEEWSMRNPYTAPEDCCLQNYVTFIRKTDGKMYACGMDIGHNVKKVQYFGDLNILDSDYPGNYTRNYSPYFLEITVEEMKGRLNIEEGENL